MEGHGAAQQGALKAKDEVIAGGSGSKVKGRPVLSRTIRGPPVALKTIIMKMGGRWYDQAPYGLHYRGGYTCYVHNVYPLGFTLTELMRAVLRILGESPLPSRFWYHRHGVEFPTGLRVIQDETDFLTMWGNAMDHSNKCVVVYTQDLEFDFNPNLQKVMYQAPESLPTVVGSFDPSVNYALAQHLNLLAEKLGPADQWKMECDGEAWYVSTESVPRVYGA